MAYVSRANAAGIIPAPEATRIFESMVQRSAIMQLGNQMPNMTSAQQRIPVLSLLPEAYFVNGDTGLKGTTNIAWENKYFNAEEIAVLIPVPQAVYDDAQYDIWAAARPRIEQAIGKAFDQAVLYGTNAPAAWPTAIVTDALAKSKVITEGTLGDLYDDILGPGGIADLVDTSGYSVNGYIGAPGTKAKLRGIRTTYGEPVFNMMMQDGTRYELDGQPIAFPQNGGIVSANSSLIAGDWSQLLWTVRQDITYRIFDQGVISAADGTIVHNLMQQDMYAMRVVMRLAWQLPNPINAVGDANRYPFAVLKPAA